jgi:hypothetical protein
MQSRWGARAELSWWRCVPSHYNYGREYFDYFIKKTGCGCKSCRGKRGQSNTNGRAADAARILMVRALKMIHKLGQGRREK